VLYSLSIIGVWQSVGFNLVLFLAGLTAIPRELYSAAEIDGAKSGWDRFRLVTWPMLGPTTLFVTTISVISSVKVFETVKTLTEGGPNKASEVLLYTIYQEGFVYLRVGYASAMTVVFLAILVVLMFIQYRVQDKQVHYS
jgi:multiple sugar transport system permease protein